MSEGNQNQWLIWLIVVGVVIVTLIAFNYQGDQSDVIPLSEIFPEDEVEETREIEYEFITAEGTQAEVTQAAPSQASGAVQPPPAIAPVTTQPAVTSQPTTMVSKEKYYTIQALASKNKASTQKALEKVKKKYPNAFIFTKDLGDKGVWYRVYIGTFDTNQQAKDYLPKVKEDYSDSFIRLVKSN